MKISTHILKHRGGGHGRLRRPRNELYNENLKKASDTNERGTKTTTRKMAYHRSEGDSRANDEKKENVATFQYQALEIEPLDTEYDPSTGPKNGREFLMQMLYEREHCPVIVRCPKYAYSGNLGYFQNLHSEHMAAAVARQIKKDTLLTPEWINVQTSTFLQARGKITLLRLASVANNGNCDLKTCSGKHPVMSNNEEEVQHFCRTNPPLLNLLLRYSQLQLEKLLECISDWLHTIIQQNNLMANIQDVSAAQEVTIPSKECSDKQVFDRFLGAWIYSTLACLQLPLEPYVYSNLREIARSCILLRSLLGSEDETRALPYNLLIVLIVYVFRQHDLKEFI